MKIALIYFLSLLSYNYAIAQQNSWNIKIESPHEPLDIFINETHILSVEELGEIEWIGTSVFTELLLWTKGDTLFIGCSKYPANCPFAQPKMIFMKKRNVLDKSFKLRIKKEGEYDLCIKVKQKHGRYIHFIDNFDYIKAFGRWYQQNTEPFEYGSSPPKRVK
jgi:hypothetical protein